MSSDDISIKTEGGQAFNIIDCYDFIHQKNSAVWYSFNFPKRWKLNRDMTIEFYYMADGYDIGKQIQLDLDLWIIPLGKSALETDPTITTTEYITTTSTNVGTYQKFTPNTNLIPQENFNTSDFIVAGKIVRNRMDTYQGIWKLIKLIVRQV